MKLSATTSAAYWELIEEIAEWKKSNPQAGGGKGRNDGKKKKTRVRRDGGAAAVARRVDAAGGRGAVEARGGRDHGRE